MKNKPKEPFVPPERHETVRKEIMDILEGRSLSVRDISGSVGVSVREIYDHLSHIQKTISKGEGHLIITPAECKKCGFVFRKRERFKKPGKCPVCRSESIEEPLFSVNKTSEVHRS